MEKKQKSKSSLKMRAISTPKTKAKSLEAAPRVHTEDTAFPVVGIGASAGGLEAFTKLFSNLPPDTGMAFVLIQHLSPQHESLLPEIISRATTMSVVEVKDRTRVVPNHVYVIPPNATMGFHDGCLRLTPRGEHEQPHLPIDFFFRSLSDEMKTNAIGIVLSGTGSDGSEGLKVLKGEGGISFAQEPDSARFKGMPQRAINVDHLDFILPPEQIALELLKISRLPFVHASLSGATIDQDIHETADTDKILTLVRQSTGVDFLRYKRTTVRRRILRRMAVNKVERFSDYYALLKESRTEQNALFDDILINVTWFFRDPEEYERMKAVIFPALIKNRRLGDPIRVWSAGCATGEEAYSIAIALLEYLGDKLGHYPIQIFASDLSESCIAKARTGKYTDSISENVSPERLAKFFVKSDAGYQVNKLVRDLCVFAKQDLVNDPPYSKLDFISCRNVLIYLESSLQQKALTVFNYVLKPTGFLVLGISETPNVAAKFFNRIGKKGKIYSVNPKSAQARPVFTNSKNLVDNTFSGGGRASFSSVALDTVERETDRLLAAHYAPPSVVINENLEIIQFRGDTSPFLVNQTGRANFQILKMARDILAPHLKSLIEAAKKGAAAKSGSIKVRNGDKLVLVSLEVIPVRALSTSRCFLILFTKPDASSSAQDTRVKARGKPEKPTKRDTVQALTQELADSREYLESLNRELEHTNQDLQSANEEVISANEELQSTNEELETAKEELQSGNEELTTVNDELQNRNVELDRLNNDLTNLLSSIEIPILIVGRDGRIRRITPAAERALSLQESDVGRPMREIQPNFEVLKLDLDLEQKVADVVNSMRATETEIQDRESRWFRLQIRPYRTLDNRIDGAVIALVDIDGLKRSLNAITLARSEAESARMAAESGNRAKDLFLATLSHELRTPLTTILSYAQMLRMGKLSPEASKKGVLLIEQSALSQAQLIDDLLDVSRIIMGKLSLDVQEVDPILILYDCVESVRPSAERKSIKVEVTSPNSKVFVLADPTRLKQIFLNLLTNAIKFSQSDGRIEVVMDCLSSGESVRFTFRDFGQGISEKFLPHLFERFSQADNSSTRVHSGMGLGLTIVRSLVEGQGGSVSAESPGKGKGATFTVTFPAIGRESLDRSLGPRRIDAATPVSYVPQRLPALEGLRILLVDDDSGARDSIGLLLTSLGAVVAKADSGQAALDLMQNFRPDILISDLAMPGEDGYSLIARVRKLPPEQFGQIPALALTAYASVEDIKQVKEAGFQAHLAKPVDAFNLAKVVSEVFRSIAQSK